MFGVVTPPRRERADCTRSSTRARHLSSLVMSRAGESLYGLVRKGSMGTPIEGSGWTRAASCA